MMKTETPVAAAAAGGVAGTGWPAGATLLGVGGRPLSGSSSPASSAALNRNRVFGGYIPPEGGRSAAPLLDKLVKNLVRNGLETEGLFNEDVETYFRSDVEALKKKIIMGMGVHNHTTSSHTALTQLPLVKNRER